MTPSQSLLARWRTTEFLPHWVMYGPVYAWWALWAVTRTRSWFFFPATNPGIENGGLLGERKSDVYQLLPAEWIPTTVKIPLGSSWEQVEQSRQAAVISFPLIAKPDVLSGKGFLVEKIEHVEHLRYYHEVLGQYMDYLLQEFVPYDTEISIFYVRHPKHAKGRVTSLTIKQLMYVTGNGTATVKQLVEADLRSALQLPYLEQTMPYLLERIPAHGECVLLVPIGNHARGATFLNGQARITPQFEATCHRLFGRLPGIYYGRFDLKCVSVDEFEQGGDFKVLEVNGVGADPTHIYAPNERLWRIWRDLLMHWRLVLRIAQYNKRTGVGHYSTFKQGAQAVRAYKQGRKDMELRAQYYRPRP